MHRLTGLLCAALLFPAFGPATARADDAAKVLLEIGRDAPETRLFSACIVRTGETNGPLLAVAGFTNSGEGDVSDLAVYRVQDDALVLLSRAMRRGDLRSSIRTLKAADLDGDGVDEMIGLGRSGDEEADSSGELHIYEWRDKQLHPRARTEWQSGKYTHGYGMDVGDVDADGSPEIVTGGFFSDGERESAELRIWKLRDDGLRMVLREHWHAPQGDTRINAVSLGDVTGDGRVEIVTAGRTGEKQDGEHATVAEGDQLVVWSVEKDRLRRVALYEGDAKEVARFRELQLAELDGRPGLEILAAGRAGAEGGRGPGAGRGGGGGGGTGGGHGSQRTRPTLKVFRVQEGQVRPAAEGKWPDDVLGEIRDLAVVGTPADARVLTIAADDLKPSLAARLCTWSFADDRLALVHDRFIKIGEATRARRFVLWKAGDGQRLFTVGFVKRGDQILGQILDWGSLP